MRALTIDPGIDVTGWAAWETDRLGRGLDGSRAIPALVRVGSIRTLVQHSVPARLVDLARQLALLCAQERVEVACIEMPPDWHGARERGQGRQTAGMKASIAKLNRAVGACIVAAAAGGERRVIGLPASRAGKQVRLMVAARLARAGASEIRPRNEDERSAVWMGIELFGGDAWQTLLAPVPSAS